MSKYIDADKAIKEIIAERDDGSLDGEYKDGFIDGMSTAAKILDEWSAADVQEVRHGRWVINERGVYECSICGRVPTAEQKQYDRYCSWCGAKMQDELDDLISELYDEDGYLKKMDEVKDE